MWRRGQCDKEIQGKAHLNHALLPFHPQGSSLHRPLCNWYAWIICQRHSWIVAGERCILGTSTREVRYQISQSDYRRLCLKYLLKPGKCVMQVFARRVDAVHKLLLLLTCSEPWHCTFRSLPALEIVYNLSHPDYLFGVRPKPDNKLKTVAKYLFC